MSNQKQRILQPSLFRQYLRQKMISLLDSIPGNKLLMIQISIQTPINIIAQKRMLYQHGIPEQGGIIRFESIIIDNNFDQILVMMSPSANNLKTLKSLIQKNIEKKNKKYYICFCPKRTYVAKQYLKQQNLLSYIEMKDFSFDLLPLDIDLYSLEIKNLKENYIYQNHWIYTNIAQSIHRLQCVFGKIHNIFGKGKAARAVFEIFKLKQKEIRSDETYGDIQSLILVDRAVDWLTPLLKQITFQGLIDQTFGINGTVVKIPAAIYDESMGQKKTETAFKSLNINSQKDYIYEQIRILTINGVRTVLKNKGIQFDNFRQESKAISDIHDKSSATKRIQVEREYLTKNLNLNSILLQQMKTIAFHKELILQQKCILEKQKDIITYFQDLIAFEQPLEKILRSMCLQCLVDKGISKKVYGRICQDIAYTYGIEHIISLTNLANMGLFYEQGTFKQPYKFSEIKKQLKLISETVINHQRPTDPSFAYGGYTPIVTKLVQSAIHGGWKNIHKALSLIPGENIMPSVVKECQSHPRPVVLVYFIGGVTYGEISTIRLLGKLYKKQIIVATTEILNGDTLIKQLIE